VTSPRTPRPVAQAVPVPRQSALSRAIARRIGQLDPREVDRQRWGRKIADRRHAPNSPQQLATRVLQRVEMDHSPLKVVVGTDAGPIGQPWLSLLIDYYSRMVVGFCLGFEPPSYAVIMSRHHLDADELAEMLIERQGLRNVQIVDDDLAGAVGSQPTA
jgi:transposase InsO family protein